MPPKTYTDAELDALEKSLYERSKALWECAERSR
jgi:hypothetical protein